MSTIPFTTIAFCVSFRWEKDPMIVIEGLKMFWKETQNHRIPHILMTLKGRFKGGKNMWWYCVPLAYQTKSGIPTIRWIVRILYCRCDLEKQKRCFLFTRDNGIKAIIGDYDPLFRNLL